MSFEINPVLAGKFDTPDTAVANSAANINAAAAGEDTSQATSVDSRRYTQFDRTITDAGTATLSFGDVLDMINPLQHIPVVSSVYRAIVGEDINPVSRVTGDIIFGGFLGLGSAVLGGMSAVADAGLAQTTGKDSGGLALAWLFGPDDDTQKSVQLADATTNPTATPIPPPASPATVTKNIELAQNTPPVPASAALAIAGNLPAPTQHMDDTTPSQSPTSVAATSETAPTAATTDTASNSLPAAPTVPPAPPKPDGAPASSAPSGTIPLLASADGKSGKQAFGGVMGQANPQAQDMALALAQGAPSVRLGHTILTNPLVNGQHPLPPMLSLNRQPTSTSIATANAVTPAALKATSASNPAAMLNAMSMSGMSGGMSPMPGTQLSSDLSQDMMLKALSQYRSMAAGPNNTGSTVNLSN